MAGATMMQLPPDRDDLITLADAAELYRVDRRTLLRAAKEDHKLTLIQYPHDERYYLLKSELQAYFRPRVISRPDTPQAHLAD
jgi:hypothetical protein